MNSQKRLNQVTKIGRAGTIGKNGNIFAVDNINEDGYLTWLYTIDRYRKSGINNPYFPVIHDLKIFKDTDGKIHYRVNMEKLVSIQSPKILGNRLVMSSLCDAMFGKDISNDTTEDEVPDEYYRLISHGLARGLENAKTIKDKNLREALTLVNELIEKNPAFMEDIYSNNIMWRITQLHISTPSISRRTPNNTHGHKTRSGRLSRSNHRLNL